MVFSQRVNAISSSPTMKLVQIKNQMVAQGKKVLDFGAGEPDFPTPDNIKQAGISAIQANFTKYTATPGIQDLKKAVRTSYLREQSHEPTDAEIVVSPGSKYSLFLLLQAVIDPGDEVIIPQPYWVSYPEMVLFCGGKPVFADHVRETPLFALTADSFIRCHTPKTKVVIVNSPSNPTGKVMNRAELQKLLDYFTARQVLVVIDDCYRRILYTDEPYPSALAMMPQAKEWIAVVASLSKSYAMTGWRIGYTIAHAPLIAAMVKIQEHSTSNPCSISQKAAVEALSGDQEGVDRMVAEYRRRRDYFARRIDEIGNIPYSMPDGAFYFFADFSHYIAKKGLQNDNDLAMQILENLGIILVPGSAFGSPGYLRISYATAMDTITAGLDRLAEFLTKP